MTKNFHWVFCFYIVHDTGLKTRTDTWVWVWRVRVRVRFEAPAPNPYPCHGFGGFLYINNIKYNIIKLNKNTSLASPKMVFDITRRVVHLLATPKMVFGVTKRCTNTWKSVKLPKISLKWSKNRITWLFWRDIHHSPSLLPSLVSLELPNVSKRLQTREKRVKND
jgi:hypothetical protein